MIYQKKQLLTPMNKRKEVVLSTEKTIEKLAEHGLNMLEIEAITGIDDSTLKRNYEEFLTKGKNVLKMKLKRKQIEIALRGNVPMLIWLGKQYLDQKDNSQETNEIKILLEKKELTGNGS